MAAGTHIALFIFFPPCQEVPEGTPECLAGLTFVISGTLDRLVALDLHCMDINIFFAVVLSCNFNSLFLVCSFSLKLLLLDCGFFIGLHAAWKSFFFALSF